MLRLKKQNNRKLKSQQFNNNSLLKRTFGIVLDKGIFSKIINKIFYSHKIIFQPKRAIHLHLHKKLNKNRNKLKGAFLILAKLILIKSQPNNLIYFLYKIIITII